MAAEINEDIIRRFWEEVFNQRKLELVDKMVTADYIYHGPAGQLVEGAEGLKGFLQMYFGAFPDVKVEIQDIFSQADKVASRVVGKGTHQGDLMGVQPTGRTIEVTVICINRFEGNRIAEDWEMIDMFGMMQQLGVIPTPGQV